MTIYNLYIYDRNGVCLYYHDWQRRKTSNLPQDEEFKLMYGMLFSLKSFVTRMSPIDSKDKFMSFKTSKYKLNFMETATGVKLILNTDITVGKIDEILYHMYKLYVEYVVRNPLSSFGEPVENEQFINALNTYTQNLPIYY